MVTGILTSLIEKKKPLTNLFEALNDKYSIFDASHAITFDNRTKELILNVLINGKWNTFLFENEDELNDLDSILQFIDENKDA